MLLLAILSWKCCSLQQCPLREELAYVSVEIKKTIETVVPETMEEEVTDRHMSGLGIPHLRLITSLRWDDQLEQKM